MRQNGDGRRAVRRDAAERRVRPLVHDLVGVREAFRVAEGLAGIDQNRPEPQRLREGHERDRDVHASHDDEAGRGTEHVDEDLSISRRDPAARAGRQGRAGLGEGGVVDAARDGSVLEERELPAEVSFGPRMTVATATGFSARSAAPTGSKRAGSSLSTNTSREPPQARPTLHAVSSETP